jgi:molybdate transport system substrate-binding protein
MNVVRRRVSGQWVVCAILASLSMLAFSAARAADPAPVLRVISGGAAKAAVVPLANAWAKAAGVDLRLEFAPMGAIADRLARGETFDLLIMTPEALAPLARAGRLASESPVPIARTGIGVAVKATAPRADVSTPAALRELLLRSRSLVYIDPRIGTSGRYVAEALEKMGIAADMAPRTTLGTGGFVVEPVGRGEIDVGIHQVTEILPVAGVVLAGELPAPLQHYTEYQGAIPAGAAAPALARALVSALVAPSAAETYRRTGFVLP